MIFFSIIFYILLLVHITNTITQISASLLGLKFRENELLLITTASFGRMDCSHRIRHRDLTTEIIFLK